MVKFCSRDRYTMAIKIEKLKFNYCFAILTEFFLEILEMECEAVQSVCARYICILQELLIHVCELGRLWRDPVDTQTRTEILFVCEKYRNAKPCHAMAHSFPYQTVLIIIVNCHFSLDK